MLAGKGASKGRAPALYWLLRTSVREIGLLGFHRPPLSGSQVGLSHRSRRERVFVHKRKHGGMGSRLSRKACTGCMRELQKTSLGMMLRARWPGPPAVLSNTWSGFRLPSGSHGAAHLLWQQRSPFRLHGERKELVGSLQESVAPSLDGVVLG